jgi:photosystem II stability/assembly factor-like uncharacterized protein
MKLLITLELTLLFLATTFQSHNPPGWYQQQLPMNNVTVQDIFFIDSLRGWVSAMNASANDTAFIFHTTDSGNNWVIQFKDSIRWINVLQFFDENTGYAGGGFGHPKFLKTTNGGNEWQIRTPPDLSYYSMLDMKFINKDTGWSCSDDLFDGGIFKTTDGGNSWIRQTDPSFRPLKLFFLNRDTGWAISNNKIFKTINGGNNWANLNSFGYGLRGLFFISSDIGWIIRLEGQNSIIKTTNGGLDWFVQQDPTPFGSVNEDIFIIDDSTGWIASGRFTILSLVNDSIWGRQSVPSGFPGFNAIQMLDKNVGFSGGTMFVKTNNGGGMITEIEENSETVPNNFVLLQNYPNPFNPQTTIKYELTVTSFVKLGVYDIEGRLIEEMINKKQNTGNYEVEFDGSLYSSGTYFYRLYALDLKTEKSFTQTKKMVLIR